MKQESQKINCESNVWEYELLDWINEEKLSWFGWSDNPNAIHVLENEPQRIRWNELSENPNAIHLLEKNPEEICDFRSLRSQLSKIWATLLLRV
jgi:hypothetical protein